MTLALPIRTFSETSANRVSIFACGTCSSADLHIARPVSDHLLGSKNGQTALCHIISGTIRLELEVTGVTPAKADADIKCGIVKANLPRGRREATFNIVVLAYDWISVQKVSFMQVCWYLE